VGLRRGIKAASNWRIAPERQSDGASGWRLAPDKEADARPRYLKLVSAESATLASGDFPLDIAGVGSFGITFAYFGPTLSLIMQQTRSPNTIVWLAVTAGIALSTPGLFAQSPDKSPITHAISCLDTVSIAPSIPSIVYLRATIKEPVDSGVGQMADLFAQSVSLRMRALLNAKGDTLPPGEPLITWHGIKSHIPLAVTIYRNAAPVFQLISPHTDSAAAAILLTAVHKTLDEDEGPFWPDGTSGDSLTFGLRFELTNPGKLKLDDTGRIAFPVFSVFFPPQVSARLKHKSLPTYPPSERSEGITAVIIMDFLVDSTGHAIPGSMKEVWSPTKKRPTGQMLAAYNDFLDSVTRWLPKAEFEPARIGGCKVTQLVREPFTFSISGMQ